jgi:monofunctional biosynthetic peptidoglycan transglycosylase
MRRHVLRTIGWVAGVWLFATIGAVLGLRWLDPPATMVMLLEPGPLDEIEYRWIDRRRMPIDAARAVIAAEDQRFLEHFGFDFNQLREAIDDYRSGDELRGASTISQQVAKNLFLWNGRSVTRKALEAYFTLLIEAFWSKQRILEVYLNVAEFGSGIFGIDAAADRLLGTQAGSITGFEAALLAAVLPSPKRLLARDPSSYLRNRQAEIFAQMRLLQERGHYAGLLWDSAPI